MDAIRIGMILPSSNTVVEPVASAMVADLCAALPADVAPVSVHFSRFALTAVQVDNPAATYYDSGALLGAAKLLADARCHVICWNGSAGGLVGFERDRQLCREITAATGSAATTASLALLDSLKHAAVRQFALITLNPPEMNETIKAHFAQEGFACAASTHRTGITDNFAMAQVPPETIAADATGAIGSCGNARPSAVVIYGTNTRGAPVARMLEARLGMPVFDSVAWGVFGALLQAGVDIRSLTAWAPHAPI